MNGINKINAKDPHLVARIHDLIESGLNPEDIATALTTEDAMKSEKEELGEIEVIEREQFPDEILLMSQALAFREPTMEDIDGIVYVLNDAYTLEIEGAEAFRKYNNNDNVNNVKKEANGKTNNKGLVVDENLIKEMMESKEYKFLITEAPDGRGVEEDGTILGVCCYTTDGVSRRNNEIEGNLGSIRYFGVLKRYHGVTIGQRLLYKVEKMMLSADCVRSMACISSTRASLGRWLERRGYQGAGGLAYPFQGLKYEPLDSVAIDDVLLLRYLKSLKEENFSSIASGESKNDSIVSKLTLNKKTNHNIDNDNYNNVSNNGNRKEMRGSKLEECNKMETATIIVEENGENAATITASDGSVSDDSPLSGPTPPYVEGQMHLPPVWRMMAASAQAAASTDTNKSTSTSSTPISSEQ